MQQTGLMDYFMGFNINGNWETQSRKIDSFLSGFEHRLSSIESMTRTGLGLQVFDRISNTVSMTFGRVIQGLKEAATEMESSFAQLKSVLGSDNKTLEAIKWAQKRGADTPFDTKQVIEALVSMTTAGFNKQDKTKDLNGKEISTRDRVFNNLGNFASSKSVDFSDVMDMAVKAGYGNFERLGDNFNLRRETFRTQLQNLPTYQNLDPTKKTEVNKWLQIVEKGKAGTNEFKMAVIDLMGVMGGDGMANGFKTIKGVMSSVEDIVTHTYQNIVGITQMEGSLTNSIIKSLDGLLNQYKLVETHKKNVRTLTEEHITAEKMLERTSIGLGRFLTDLWRVVSNDLSKATEGLIGWLSKVDDFFQDYKNKVAPFILYLAILRIEVANFFKGFAEGFKEGFGMFWGVAKTIIFTLGEFLALFTPENESQIEKTGKAIGFLTGSLIGLQAVNMALSPIRQLSSMLFTVWVNGKNLFEFLGNARIGASLRLLRMSINGVLTSVLGISLPLWGMVAAVVAIGAAVYLVYTYWDDIWNTVKNMDGWMVGLITYLNPVVGLTLWIMRNFEDIKLVVGDLFSAFVNFAVGVWNYGKAYVIKLFNSWDKAWTNVKNGFNTFIERFPILGKIIMGIGGIIQKYIVEPFTWFFDKIGSWFKQGSQWLKEVSSDFRQNSGNALAEAEGERKQMYDPYGYQKGIDETKQFNSSMDRYFDPANIGGKGETKIIEKGDKFIFGNAPINIYPEKGSNFGATDFAKELKNNAQR